MDGQSEDPPNVVVFITCPCGHDEGHKLDQLIADGYEFLELTGNIVAQCPDCWEHYESDWGRIHHEGDSPWFKFDLESPVEEPSNDEGSQLFGPYREQLTDSSPSSSETQSSVE